MLCVSLLLIYNAKQCWCYYILCIANKLLSYLKSHLVLVVFVSVMVLFLSPLKVCCMELNIMPLFYVYSGLISCIVSQVTLGFKNKYFNSPLSIIYIYYSSIYYIYLSNFR